MTQRRPAEAGHHPDRTMTGTDIVIIMMAMTEDVTIRQGGGLQEGIIRLLGGETELGYLLLLLREEAE